MSTYTAQAPQIGAIDSRIVKFFEDFYTYSDSPDKDNEYVESLTKDGKLIMGLKTSSGSDEIMTLRKGLWNGPVKTRKHQIHRLYGFSDKDIMLHGSVDYGLKNGKDVSVDWAAHAQFADEDGKLKMKFYQVYLDSTPVAQAASS